ncbi:MAG: hypothetical protein IJI46_08460 [Erysipelotrichaceae bacterium]|nr:hypothetical protein [Erysipelotrichaceae bacterium]
MKDKTLITFHSGLDSIGGVIMEVRYGDDRAFFEAGTAYNPAFDMFDGKVDMRKDFIKDYLWINEIPKINGIYRREDIAERYPDLICAEDYPINKQAFFITHLHLDHMRMMGMIDPSIPVYLSKPAQIIEKALEDVGEGVQSIRGSLYSDMEDEMDVGKIHIKRFILNDDSYQDYSFYIETPDLKLHHTGDVFVYGKYLDNILKEISFLKDKLIDILSCEGTRFFADIKSEDLAKIHPLDSLGPSPGMISFDRLKERISETINAHKGLVILNYYEREMSDVLLFNEIAQNTSRQLVYEPESAHIINSFFHYPVNVLVPDTYKEEPTYLKEILSYNRLLSKKDILAQPDNYIVQNTYPNLLELLDYQNMNALYLHHSGIPLGEYDPKYRNMMNIINSCHMIYDRTYFGPDGYFSPHAETYQLITYIEMIQPKLVVPCHSNNRKAFEQCITLPYFHAREKVSYSYDPILNTLKEIDHE